MCSIRRALVVFVGMGFASTLTFAPRLLTAGEDKVLLPIIEGARQITRQQKAMQVQVQPVPVAAPAGDKKDDKKAGADPVTLPTDRKAKQSIGVARDMIESQLWGEAARVLQALLDTKEDVFVEVERNGVNHWVSLHGEANRLLSTMPPQGRQFYELQFGARAKARLAEAKAKSSQEILAEVANRYLHTEAGAEATKLLGDYNLDRGNFIPAALCYDRLLSHERAAKMSPVALFKATLAFRRAGDLMGKDGESWEQKADKTWKQLAQAARGGLRINDQKVTIEQLQGELDRFRTEDVVVGTFDWGLFKGNASRSAQGNGSAPFLEYRWFYPTWKEEPTRQWLGQAVKYQEEHNNPVLSGFFPIAVTVRGSNGSLPLLVYRSHWGIHARNLNKDGKLEWDAPSYWSIDYIVNPDEPRGLRLQTEQWQWPTLYLNTYPNLLYENSTVGTLSSDGTHVFRVEDLQLPPHPQCNPMQQLNWGQTPSFGAFHEALHHSRLQAFHLGTGKIVWELGGRESDKGDLADCYFLGPPLPVGDKLYVLIDKQSELRLVCLDPPRDPLAKPTINWIQTLANVSNQNKMLIDVGRRMQGAPLSYSDGILVCPTNAGVVVAVDILSHSLVWAYNYREEIPSSLPDNHLNAQQKQIMMMNGQMRPANLNFDWKASAPVIQEGRVVFTAPDAGSLHCLDLRTGDLLWKQARSDDLYLGGVYHGKVVLVGRTTCRALDLNDGRQVWRLETGLPSGQGVASDNVYYLPLKSGAQSREPEVCAIDIDKGVILAHAKSRKKEVPGNLIFFEGYVISQTVDRITAYQQLRVKLQEIDLALEANPRDPRGLTERGEMKLGKGDLAGAVEDLRLALANKPPADILEKTRGKLFETLTELFQRDFNGSEKYLDEYKAMCEVTIPADATMEDRKRLEEERQNRQANFLCLLAKGREQQGRLIDAFQAYMEFSAKAADRNLVPVVDEPTIRVRPDVLAQGRIAAMVAKAKPEQRQPLQDLIAKRWAEVKAGNNLAALRRFVAVFGSLFNVGKEARFHLAERLLQENPKDQPNAFLEAELHLIQLRHQDDPGLAARAVEALARLMIRKGLLEDAAYWYRLLGRDFAKVVIRDGKTGADFFQTLATDKRLLAYLDEPRSPWEGARIKGKEASGSSQTTAVLPFEPEGEVLPFFDRNRVTVQAGSLKVADRASGEERWTQSLSTVPNINYNYMGGGNHAARYPFTLQGHLIVINVGTMVYAFDPVNRKKLWERSLTGNTSTTNGQIMMDKDGTLQVTYPDGYFHKLGRTGPVEASYVCLNTREGLVALDPLQGTILWTKSDVPPRTHVFGDEQYIYLVEVRPDGAVANGRALRARDGAAVDVPDFAGAYQRRLRTMGRHILVSENDPRGAQVVLRLYDVPTGKDIWKQTFKAGAVVLHSEEADLVGAVEPANGGKVTIYDLRTREKVLETQVDPKELDKVHEVHLLVDDDFYYLASNRSPDQQMNPWGGAGPFPTVMPGIRCLTANGMIYAFHRDPKRRADKGPLAWKVDSPNLMVIVDQFKDLPVLILTAWSQDMNMAQRGTIIQNSLSRIIEKRTGKLLCEVQEKGRNQQFHTLKANARAGTIELIGQQKKIVAYVDTDSKVAGPQPGAAETTPKKDGVGTPARGGGVPGVGAPGAAAPGAAVLPRPKNEPKR
jgi:outer membrane protein assembly factor BamB